MLYLCTHKSRGGPDKIGTLGSYSDQRLDGGSNLQFCSLIIKFKNISRGGAVAARWAHNPKVGGSNPSPATKISR
jgi:hypothetical protein